MAYNVVKNLIPKELVEYDEIIANLEQIKQNPNKLEENKVLGREILEMIKNDELDILNSEILFETEEILETEILDENLELIMKL